MNSLTLFHVRGVPVRAHISLLIAIPYFAFIIFSQFQVLASLAGVDTTQMLLPPFAWGLLLAFLLFVCIGLHELGHTLLALRARRRVKSITLMLFGGVSFIDDGESHEASIAAMGPVISLGLAIACYVAYKNITGSQDLKFCFFNLSQINMTIAAFNMIPAYPLDGGRVLRALVAKKLGTEKATAFSVLFAKIFAMAFAVIGLLNFNFILIVIAFLIFTSGAQETAVMQYRKALQGLSAGDVMRSRFHSVGAGISADLVLDELVRRDEAQVPVVHSGGRMLGVINRRALLKVPQERRGAIPVGMLADDEVPRIKVSDAAVQALDAILNRWSENTVVAVGDEQERLVGLIGLEDLARSIRARAKSDFSRAA